MLMNYLLLLYLSTQKITKHSDCEIDRRYRRNSYFCKLCDTPIAGCVSFIMDIGRRLPFRTSLYEGQQGDVTGWFQVKSSNCTLYSTLVAPERDAYLRVRLIKDKTCFSQGKKISVNCAVWSISTFLPLCPSFSSSNTMGGGFSLSLQIDRETRSLKEDTRELEELAENWSHAFADLSKELVVRASSNPLLFVSCNLLAVQLSDSRSPLSGRLSSWYVFTR